MSVNEKRRGLKTRDIIPGDSTVNIPLKMTYIHPDITEVQSSKHPGQPCGDVICWRRGSAGTLLILADGLGSGVTANLDATLFVSWLRKHLTDGMSLRQGMERVVQTCRKARTEDVPFAAISTARIRPDGSTVILSHEAPPPIVVSDRCATVPRHHTLTMASETVRESHCRLQADDALMLFSDGITQAGLGTEHPRGWTIDGARKRIHHLAQSGKDFEDIARIIHDEAREMSREGHDDTTVVLAHCRQGSVVNILTGPPSDPDADAEIVRRFFRVGGRHIICGGTTAEIAARETGEIIDMEQEAVGRIAPPRSIIDGVDLVTEGSISLNQLYNIWDEEPDRLEEDSAVTDLYRYLHEADRVNFVVGQAENPATGDIAFSQQGILKREKIVPLLTEKLKKAGKLVDITWV